MLAQLRNDPLLGPDVARVMQQQRHTQDPRMPGMGYTFEQRPRNGRQLVYKDGDVPGFHNVMALLPGEELGIYVAYNGDGTNLVASSDGVRLIDQIVDRYLPAAPAHPQGIKGDVSRFAGTYRSARVSHDSLLKVASLFSAPTVEAGADGTLTTTGLSPDPAKETQHWIQTQPGLFEERGGQDRIAFDGKGTMTTSANPSEALERLAWYDSPMPHVGVLGFGALVFVLALLGFPIVALVRTLRGRPRHPAGARVARLLAWITGLLVTVFLVGIALVTSDPNALMETTALNSPRLAVVPIVVTVAFGFAVPGAAGGRRGLVEGVVGPDRAAVLHADRADRGGVLQGRDDLQPRHPAVPHQLSPPLYARAPIDAASDLPVGRDHGVAPFTGLVGGTSTAGRLPAENGTSAAIRLPAETGQSCGL